MCIIYKMYALSEFNFDLAKLSDKLRYRYFLWSQHYLNYNSKKKSHIQADVKKCAGRLITVFAQSEANPIRF